MHDCEGLRYKHWSFQTPPPPVPDKNIIETIDTDIVVVGAGLAGLCAALRAAELGADVVVLEKMNSWNVRGGMIGAANSKPWRNAGIVNDKAVLVRDWIAASGNRAREEQVWLFVNSSEEAMNWLIERQAARGAVPRLVGARYSGPNYTERYGALVFNGPKKGGIQEAAENLWKDCMDLGVRFFFETPGVYLEKNEDRVTAVIAGKQENYRRYKASKGVVLATGDIHGDTEMLEAYCPVFLKVKHSQYTPQGANTGDGHKMGLWVGGAMEEPPFPTIMHPQGYNRMQAFFLFVNTDGDRFMNEDTWCQAKSINVLKQPGGVDYAYSIFDSDWQAQMIEGMPYSGGLFNDNSYSAFGAPFTGEKERVFIESGLISGLVVKADTLDELAIKIHVPAQKMSAAVSRYNGLVARKEDPDFGKRPELLFPIRKAPFYASKFGPAMLAVTGGLLVDTHLRVVDGRNNPIPGLYAVGNVAGGLYGVDYTTIIPGNSHGRAVTWGYLAAGNALEDSSI
jgi:succinate dehydrogenase/fumarate reductase flavoprotein subunit